MVLPHTFSTGTIGNAKKLRTGADARRSSYKPPGCSSVPFSYE